MKFKELCGTISMFENIQVGDSATGEPITFVTTLSDSDLYVKYRESDVHEIRPMVDNHGNPFLAILLEGVANDQNG